MTPILCTVREHVLPSLPASIENSLRVFPQEYVEEEEQTSSNKSLLAFFPSFVSDVYRVLDVILSSTELRGASVHHISISFDMTVTPIAWIIVAYKTGAVILLAKPKITVYDVDLVVDKSDEIASIVDEDYEVIPAVAGYVVDYDAERYAKSIDVPVFNLDLYS